MGIWRFQLLGSYFVPRTITRRRTGRNRMLGLREKTLELEMGTPLYWFG